VAFKTIVVLYAYVGLISVTTGYVNK